MRSYENRSYQLRQLLEVSDNFGTELCNNRGTDIRDALGQMFFHPNDKNRELRNHSYIT